MSNPWKYQTELKKKKLPNQQELLLIINKIPEPRIRALISIAYLTGGRISEIVPTKYLYKAKYEKKTLLEKTKLVQVNKQKTPLDYKGICKQDINYETWDGQKLLTIELQNRKNKKQLHKKIPIPVEKEGDFVTYIEEYTRTLPAGEPLFKFGTHRSWELIRKHTGYNCHMFRDIRATHLVTIYGFNAWQLKLMLGWTDVRPSEHYVLLNLRDLWKGKI